MGQEILAQEQIRMGMKTNRNRRKRKKVYMGRKKPKTRSYIRDNNFVEFPYHSDCSCCKSPERLSKTIESLATPKEDFERALRTYLKDVGLEYNKAIKRSIKQIASKLAELNNPSLQQVNDLVVFNLLNNWKSNFADRINPLIKTNITKFYKIFRSDTSIFRGTGIDIPKSTFSTTDLRTIAYMRDLDELYLGRFITDRDTRKRITRFIRNKHIAGAFQNDDLKLFREEFQEFMELEDWKISRILATTTSKLRSAASLNYLKQAEIDTFEIRGINDRLQCPWCKEMQGKQFSVTRASLKLDKVINSDPQLVSEDSPFLLKVIPDPVSIRELTGDQLQDQNIDLPPFHPNCRDRIIAVI